MTRTTRLPQKKRRTAADDLSPAEYKLPSAKPRKQKTNNKNQTKPKQNKKEHLSVVAHVFNSCTLKVEAGRSVSLGSAWFTQGVPVKPELH